MTSSVEIKVRVGDGESPYRKIAVDVGRLVWSNHPLHTDDHIVLQMFGRDTILRFDNGRKGRPKKVEFEVTTELEFDRFMSRHTHILIVHGQEVIGTSCFDPELMQEKMLLPVFANHTQTKLGDFSIRVTITKPPTDQLIMNEISSFLRRLQHQKPELLAKLHSELQRQQYI